MGPEAHRIEDEHVAERAEAVGDEAREEAENGVDPFVRFLRVRELPGIVPLVEALECGEVLVRIVRIAGVAARKHGNGGDRSREESDFGFLEHGVWRC